MKVISLATQKGGVGKTTTAQHLAAGFALKGEKVALIDLDWQGNASRGLGINAFKLKHTIYSLMKRETFPEFSNITERDVIINKYGIDIYPGNLEMANFESELGNEAGRESFLKDIISEWDYDRVFIDCHPDFSTLTKNAFVASDEIYIPVECDLYSIDGLAFLIREIEKIKKRLNHSLKIGGVLITQVNDRTKQFKETSSGLREYFKEEIFETYIRKAEKDVREAAKIGKPIYETNPDSKAAIDYLSLVDEILKRESEK